MQRKANADSITVWVMEVLPRIPLFTRRRKRNKYLQTKRYEKSDPVNLGSGKEITIKELVSVICKAMHYKGKIIWDTSKPNGQREDVLIRRSLKKNLDLKRTHIR